MTLLKGQAASLSLICGLLFFFAQTREAYAQDAYTPGAKPTSAEKAAPIPFIDPAKELSGLELIWALRRGGYVLYMRHGLTAKDSDKDLVKTPAWWDNCAIQRNLAPAGREQALHIAAAIRGLGIPITTLKASQFCRARQTAELLDLGPPTIDEGLNYLTGQRPGFDYHAARFALIAATPAPGTNTLLVSHGQQSPNPQERILHALSEADIAVFKPDGRGGAEVVARISVAEWDRLRTEVLWAKLVAALLVIVVCWAIARHGYKQSGEVHTETN